MKINVAMTVFSKILETIKQDLESKILKKIHIESMNFIKTKNPPTREQFIYP